jgi:hypothetical protein
VHGFHHLFKRGFPPKREMWASGVAKWRIVV